MGSNCFKSADYRTRESLGRMPNETFAGGEMDYLIIESLGWRKLVRFDPLSTSTAFAQGEQ